MTPFPALDRRRCTICDQVVEIGARALTWDGGLAHEACGIYARNTGAAHTSFRLATSGEK